MEETKTEEKVADEEDEPSWYEFPPGAFFFAAGVLAAVLPKDTLFAGEYTDPTAVVIMVSNVFIFVVFVKFVLVVRHVGLTQGVQWMVSPGFGVEKQ